MTGVAIVGASGYASRELFRILANHPGAKITVATSRADESPRVDALHPSLARRIDLVCSPFNADAIAEHAGVAFLALPHTASLEVVPALRQRGVKVIDLSADYRLTDRHKSMPIGMGIRTPIPAGLSEAVYGLPEIYRERIPAAQSDRQSRLLHLDEHPRARAVDRDDKIERTGIIIDAKSGVSGAGRSPKLTTHFPECNESLSAYNVGKHRHTPEIDQVLSDVGRAGAPVEVIFTPHLVPMDRGILATIYATPRGRVAEHDLMELYRVVLRGSPRSSASSTDCRRQRTRPSPTSST